MCRSNAHPVRKTNPIHPVPSDQSAVPSQESPIALEVRQVEVREARDCNSND